MFLKIKLQKMNIKTLLKLKMNKYTENCNNIY